MKSLARLILFLTATALLGTSHVVNAKSDGIKLSSEDLFNACTKADSEWIGFCNGYIQALVDANTGRNVCIAKGTTRNQIYDVLINALKDSLINKNNSDAFVVGSQALRNHFKCKS
jgi:hypothetical protein